jgi:CHAT domain-containing protein
VNGACRHADGIRQLEQGHARKRVRRQGGFDQLQSSSHWPVSSDAAVKLTTKTFAELKAHPNIGRAETLRRSMVELTQYGSPEYAHPAMWAPFVL